MSPRQQRALVKSLSSVLDELQKNIARLMGIVVRLDDRPSRRSRRTK
jgi:hypothetical protein